ncbi:MAG: recombinase family protein [Planctomycetales bacterium]|nr:recombinase family protein [Planctomycetales bacterium]MCC0025184.1 recombinase family protein [Hyphomicrobiaceae bacterium]
MSTRKIIRCAIYTRKSTDEGLDQDFNSLDAQYEASFAYIASQKHEGWKLVNERYDDGGTSGGTLERPSLQRLLSDIDAGRIDMVVVYKIDRLTRSLADFAKLVERFDAVGCSFVSVTQSFNTSSSMGRLTLNVLLSFAQFEREVTAERIRDKIAASKAKGMWMGGNLPLGYDKDPSPNSRRLVINPSEAETVRRLFTLYDELGCLNLAKQHADKENLRSKRVTYSTGRTRGGNSFSRGQLYYLLRNPTYIGKIPHKQNTYDGQHDPIIDQDLWDRVQTKLQDGAARPRRKPNDNPRSPSEISPLAGKLFDETGDRLTPSHASRKGKRHRYYVSHRLIKLPKSETDGTGWRLPAKPIEQQITNLATNHITSLIKSHRLLSEPDAAGAARLSAAADRIENLPDEQGIDHFVKLVTRCTISAGTIEIQLDQTKLGEYLSIHQDLIDPDALTLTAPFQTRKRGVETKITSGTRQSEPDTKLIAVLAQAHHWLDQIKQGKPLYEISSECGHYEDYVRKRVELAFLSPRIQQQILEGTQSPELTVHHLLKSDIPLDWFEQENRFS